MSSEENTAIIKRFFDGINQGKINVLDEVIGAGFVWHGTNNLSMEDYRKDLSGLFAAFPDAHWTIEDLIAQGDKVVIRWTFRGTQERGWEDLPATGKHVSYGGISICRVDGGKLVEVWNNENLLGLFRQLGFKMVPP
jgi:predicted ester cyclase